MRETDGKGLQKHRATLESAALGLGQGRKGIRDNKISNARVDLVIEKLEA